MPYKPRILSLGPNRNILIQAAYVAKGNNIANPLPDNRRDDSGHVLWPVYLGLANPQTKVTCHFECCLLKASVSSQAAADNPRRLDEHTTVSNAMHISRVVSAVMLTHFDFEYIHGGNALGILDRWFREYGSNEISRSTALRKPPT